MIVNLRTAQREPYPLGMQFCVRQETVRILDSRQKPAGMTLRQAPNRHARVLLAGIQKAGVDPRLRGGDDWALIHGEPYAQRRTNLCPISTRHARVLLAGIQALFWIPTCAGMTPGDDGHFILWSGTEWWRKAECFLGSR